MRSLCSVAKSLAVSGSSETARVMLSGAPKSRAALTGVWHTGQGRRPR